MCFCGIEVETVDHLFTKCVYAHYVMGLVLEGLSLEDIGANVGHV